MRCCKTSSPNLEYTPPNSHGSPEKGLQRLPFLEKRGLHQIPCQDRGHQCKTPYNYYNPDYEKGTRSFWGNPDVRFGSAYDQCNASQEEPKDLLEQSLYDMWKFLKISTKPPTPSLRSRNIPSASGPRAEPQRPPIHSRPSLCPACPSFFGFHP